MKYLLLIIAVLAIIQYYRYTHPCKYCDGTGVKDGNVCPHCHGTGE